MIQYRIWTYISEMTYISKVYRRTRSFNPRLSLIEDTAYLDFKRFANALAQALELAQEDLCSSGCEKIPSYFNTLTRFKEFKKKIKILKNPELGIRIKDLEKC